MVISEPAASLGIVSLKEVFQASKRISPWAIYTPLLESDALNRLTGGRLLFKAEVLQRVGAFKFRGAMNFIEQIDPAVLTQGVVAYSSGNHAQGVALAARLKGVPAVIVMPKDAPQGKIEGTRQYGAEIVLYERHQESREEIAKAIATERGMTLIPSYDHPWIIAGQGTTGLEIIEQTRQLDATLDDLLIPCCGGGLTAGCSIVMKALSPKTEVYAVEPEGYDDTRQSLLTGERVSIRPGERSSICDALLLPEAGELTFSINRTHVTGGLAVTDEEVLHALSMAFRHLKLVVEPAGAVGLAAVLANKIDCSGKTVGIILSGGNVKPEIFASAITGSSY